ncbi:hypothetical protein [Natronorubrum sp. FCH18a]|uniref:hypothetical protein n=1 Tax=Natronorubrum sp. FCH18a TaxID=3447018 RepID=UPI003F5138C6
MVDAEIETETATDQFEAGDIVRDSVQDERVIVLEQTEAVATEYYLLETQCTVAQCRKNKREWADDPVVEAVYESDVRRVFGDDWFTGTC